MVKIEDLTQNDIVPSRGNNVIIPKIEPSNDPLKEEFGSSSNNNNNLRSHFIEMGFNPNNVDIVLNQNGHNNNGEIILNELQALENPQRAESSISLNELFNSDNEEEEEESKPHYMSYIEKKSSLLSMNFSEEQIESALEQIGEEAQIEQFIDFIICNFQTETEIKPSSFNTPSVNDEEESNNTENLLYGISETSLLLLNRGFTENEVSNAIHIFGNKKSVNEIADLIMENRMRFNDDDSKEHVIINNSRSNPRSQNQENQESKTRFNPSTSNSSFHYQNSFPTPNQEDQENQEAKTNPTFHYQNSFLTPNPVFPNPDSHPNKKLKKPIFPNTDHPLEEESNKIALNSPYFIYGNVIPVSEEIWNRLSRFLFNIEPEFLNSQFFSCLNRKEGFIHNLPPNKREYLIPKSSDNIGSALPFTKEFWPNWDLRVKFSHNIFHYNNEINEICKRLENIVKNSDNFTKEKKNYVMEKLEEFNLIWVGDKKLGFLDSNQLERVMGYPFEHTRLSDPFERLKIMKNCFQIDTIGYILSPLKYLFPDGIRVLSIYTGIGGAEIALNRLGVRIKCLVSVDSSEIHRKIVRNWWHNCNNNEYGELRQIDGVSKVTSFKIGELIREFGGFDLIIGNWMDWNSFFEFLRILRIINGS